MPNKGPKPFLRVTNKGSHVEVQLVRVVNRQLIRSRPISVPMGKRSDMEEEMVAYVEEMRSKRK